MSALQGPRIPGEEGSGRGRRLGWIVAALVALILLALLVPFACQALTGGSGPQDGASGTQENTDAQGGAAGGDEAGSGEEAGGDGNAAVSESSEDNRGGEVASAQEKSTNASDENGSQDRGSAEGSERAAAERAGGGRADEPLPETGGSPVVLFVAGTSLVMVAAGLLALVRRQSA